MLRLWPKTYCQDGSTDHKKVIGNTPDISEYCNFGFHYLTLYYPAKKPCIWTSQETRKMVFCFTLNQTWSFYCIFPISGIPVADTTVQHVTKEDYMDTTIKAQIDELNIGLPPIWLILLVTSHWWILSWGHRHTITSGSNKCVWFDHPNPGGIWGHIGKVTLKKSILVIMLSGIMLQSGGKTLQP